ncbi:hypothetical protein BKA56DRAFT_250759 [Ilyonectria sp. MPI-CAGE-AT-0026]|nr:hypothetical protein BKA56DRAFT_250759 [Ilyonectria sp. MPI-CAGE-AT-0026]
MRQSLNLCSPLQRISQQRVRRRQHVRCRWENVRRLGSRHSHACRSTRDLPYLPCAMPPHTHLALTRRRWSVVVAPPPRGHGQRTKLDLACPGSSQSPSRDDANCKAGRSGCCTSAHRLLHRSNPPSPGTPSTKQPGLIYLGLGGRSVNPPCRINEGKPNHLGRLLCVRSRLVCSALNAGQQPQSHSQPLATLLVGPSRPYP